MDAVHTDKFFFQQCQNICIWIDSSKWKHLKYVYTDTALGVISGEKDKLSL